MPEVYTIPLSKIIHELQLETAFLPKSADDILIQSRDVVRPGMELNGYHEYFDPNRIAVLGRAEMYMLESLKPERRAMALDSYLSLKPPAVILFPAVLTPARTSWRLPKRTTCRCCARRSRPQMLSRRLLRI